MYSSVASSSGVFLDGFWLKGESWETLVKYNYIPLAWDG